MAVERIRSWVHLDVYLEGLAETELLGGETKGGKHTLSEGHLMAMQSDGLRQFLHF